MQNRRPVFHRLSTILLTGTLWLAGAATGNAQAPDGFKNAASPSQGLTLIVPQSFDEIPVPPDGEYLQMKFVDKRGGARKGEFESEIRIIKIKLAGVETGADTPEPTPENPPGGDAPPASAPASKPAAAPAPKPVPKPPPIRTFQDFVKRDMQGWDCVADGTIDALAGRKLQRFTLSKDKTPIHIAAYVLAANDRLTCLLGFAEKDAFADVRQKFERCAKYMNVKAVAESADRDVEFLYKHHPYRDVEYRKKVRASMPKGWKGEDTENFILIYDVSDKSLISKMKHDLEILHIKYMELFPPVKPIEAVSTVRVCKDRDEFLKFSEAPKNWPAAGFWNSRSMELVFYNNVKDPNYPSASWEDAFVVVYHEAFHQYIFYACGELDPHSWFNEGYGDYFSGSKITSLSLKVERVNVNPWRVGTIKKMVAERTYVPLKNIVKFEQSEYYAKGHENYAEGWSIIYFLNDSKVIKKHPLWGKILPGYLNTLIATYQAELAKLGEKPAPEKVAAARLEARKAAVEAAFADIDMSKLESEWRDFVETLVDPRAK